ncbi:MAG TPA: hypothetical protein VF596_04120 [Pyrinomonadaceae bacterium]
MGLRLDSSTPSGNIADVYKEGNHERINEPEQTQIVEPHFTAYRPQPEKLVWVTSNLVLLPDGGHALLVNETNPAHPAGEVWIADKKPHFVALTEKICEQLNAGNLVLISAEQALELEERIGEIEKAEKPNTVDERREIFDALRGLLH